MENYIEINRQVTNRILFNNRPEHFEKIKKRRHIPIANIVSKFVERNATILEIGCRTGDLFKILQEYGYNNFYGIEISEEAVEKLQDNGFEGQVDDAHTFNLNQIFDLVIMAHTLEHCPKPDKVIERVYEHLIKDGAFYVEVPIQDTSDGGLLKKSVEQDGHYHRFGDPMALLSLFDTSKWDCLYIDYSTGKNKGNIRALFIKNKSKFPKEIRGINK